MRIIDAIKEKASQYSTEIILETIRTIGGGYVDQDKRMVRAALIDLYAERTSEDAADNLMDEIGL
jgi:hypothetical protein